MEGWGTDIYVVYRNSSGSCCKSHTFVCVWRILCSIVKSESTSPLLLQHNLEGWSQPIITQLHRWAAPQRFVSTRPPSSHRHANQCVLHHIHLRGHVGECSGVGFLQGAPVSAHITHRLQKASWADAQRCSSSPHGCAQHDEDRSFLPPRFTFHFLTPHPCWQNLFPCPPGRIMNRFTKDMATIDDMLPLVLFDLIQVPIITHMHNSIWILIQFIVLIF